jgi:hypothetical protein
MKNDLVVGKKKHLSTRGRLTLINSVLSRLLMYMMFFFAILRGVLKKLNYFRSRFLWQQEEKCKYHLVKWNILCQHKDQGELVIWDLGNTLGLNLSLKPIGNQEILIFEPIL